MKISVPPHDAEYNRQPHLGEPTYDTPEKFIADLDNPQMVLQLVIRLNNIILDMIRILYEIELAALNKQDYSEIIKLAKSRNQYHMN